MKEFPAQGPKPLIIIGALKIDVFLSSFKTRIIYKE